jgi:hypothetical protein
MTADVRLVRDTVEHLRRNQQRVAYDFPIAGVASYALGPLLGEMCQ